LFNNKLLFAGEDFSKTYRDFYEDIYKLSAYMLENGFKNKKIGIYASNSYYWVLLFFATAMNVGIIAPLDKELPENELKTSAKRMGLDYIFCDDSTAQ
jgi:long-subunit acyl-CoA synthetase (AMP-forming)